MPIWNGQFETSIWSKALGDGASSLPWIALCPLSLAHWVAGVFTAGLLLQSTAVFYALGRNSVRVDVLSTETLEPFGRVGSRNGLFVLGLFAIFPLMWIARPFAVPDVSAIPLVFAFALIGTIAPMRGAQRATKDAKSARISELNREIREASQEMPGGRATFSDLADLLTVKEAVLAAREWPLNSEILERLLLYFVLPLVSWVCGAIVEEYVERLLSGRSASG